MPSMARVTCFEVLIGISWVVVAGRIPPTGITIYTLTPYASAVHLQEESTQAPTDPDVIPQTIASVASIGDASEYYSGTTDERGSARRRHARTLSGLPRIPADGGRRGRHANEGPDRRAGVRRRPRPQDVQALPSSPPRAHQPRVRRNGKCPRSVRTQQRRPERGRRSERGTVSYREPQVGIEPTTARLRIECSTTELLWRNYRRRKADGGRQCLPSAVYRLPSDNTCPGSDSNRDALRHHPLKMARLPVSTPGQSQRLHLRALQQRSNNVPPATGVTGFEPATSRVTVECSNQTELRPLPLCTLLPRAFAE